MNIYTWLKDNALTRPEKTAIRFKGREISYAELTRATNALGNALLREGLSPGDHITMILPNTPEFVISFMAAIGIGAAIVPVNPAYTPRELRHIITDSDSRALILEHSRLGTYEEIREECPVDTIITTGEEGSFGRWTSGSATPLSPATGEDDVASIIYSSGLTGYPMGAMLTHGNLDHQSDLMRLCMECDDSDTTLALIPCFHSFSSSVNLLSMLRYGGTIYLMEKLDFPELRHALTDGGVTAIGAVPTLFFGMVHHPELQEIDYSRMRTLIAGGSALPQEIYEAFREKFHAEIRQGYGITEASPTCAVNNIHVENRPASIGPTVPGVQARVVNDNGTVCAPGQIGELLFKGPNIMKGYYKREQETAEIIRDGWLYTGDLGYQDREGYLYITGYKKEMVIVSGFNVYNREVEGVLTSIPGVRDAAIMGVPDPIRGALIRAYVVREDQSLTPNDIKGFAKKELAKYKTPRKIVFVDEIPRDADGKALFEQMDQE